MSYKCAICGNDSQTSDNLFAEGKVYHIGCIFNAYQIAVKALRSAWVRSCERSESRVKWTIRDQEAHEAIKAALVKVGALPI